MALVVLVVEVESDESPGGDLSAAMTELRERLNERDVPVRRAWAGIGAIAEAVATLHDGGR